MASWNAKNYAKTVAVPPQAVDGGDYGGRVRVNYDEIDTTTSMASADTINLGYLMPGERVVGISVAWAAHGASQTIIIGDAGDTDRYLASTVVNAAGSSTALAATGVGYKNTTNSPIPIYATIGVAALAAATPGLKVALKTVRD